MIHVAWPWMALLAPLPWLIYRMRRAAEPRGSVLFVPFAAEIAAPGGASRPGSRTLRVLLALIWLLLILAAIRPQWLGDPLPVPTSGRRLLLAIDVSGSMANDDMGGGLDRLQVVQRVAGQFIEHRKGDQVGLILFGTRPYLQAPLTTDLDTVRRFLDAAVIGMAGNGTAIGDAIGMAIKRLRAADPAAQRAEGATPDPSGKHTVLVLLTDGQNTAGVMPPRQAAKLAAQVGLRVYTIGVGAPEQAGFFGFARPGSELDERTLRDIANTTGGEYFRATDAVALEKIYAKIDRLEPTAGHQQWLRPTDEWFTWPLALALILSVPAAWTARSAWS